MIFQAASEVLALFGHLALGLAIGSALGYAYTLLRARKGGSDAF